MSSDVLAELSNNLVGAAIAVFALAMVAFALDTAKRVSSAGMTLRSLASSAATPSGSGTDGPPPDDDRAGAGVDARPDGGAARWQAIGAALTTLAALFLTGGIVARGLAAERPPWGNMYEFATVAALAITVAFLAFLRRDPVRDFGVWVTGLVLVVLGLAVTVLYTPAGALVPVLDSYWLVIHVAAAIVAGGVFSVGAVASVLFLLKSRTDTRPEGGQQRYAAALPPAPTLDRVGHAAYLFAFPIWTFAVIAGAIWAENSWGRYWGWDPKETWAFITWVFYAAYLHAQSTAGWRGRKANFLALCGFVALVFNFIGVNMWITGLHSYAGV